MRKLLLIGVGILFIFIIAPFHVGAEEAEKTPLLISEIQTGSTESASHEFIELYNSTDQLVALDNYKIEYKSATGESWFTKVAFEGGSMVQPRGYFLISSYKVYERVDINQSLRLAGSGGHIRLVKTDSVDTKAVDTVGWGKADSPESESAPAPAKSESISRHFDKYGALIDTDNNAEDFHRLILPRPKSTGSLESSEKTTDTSEEIDYKAIEITELLIDPEAPLTDDDDEFIEIYNPHKNSIDVSGYVIKTGMQFRYSYELKDLEVQPHTYHVLKAEETGLTLANTQGRAAVFSPSDELLFETEAYEDAKTGGTWSVYESKWQWSMKKTPGAANKIESLDQPDSNMQDEKEKTVSESNRTNFPKLQISELMIDPIAPKTDSNDEYIELFNPNSFPVDTSEFVIKTGLPLRYQETLSGTTLEPGEYKAFYASETGLTLANSDGMAALFGNNTEIFRTEAYESAPPGAAWAYIDTSWRFTYRATPSKANVLVEKDSGTVLSGSKASDETEQMTDDEVINAVTKPAALPSSEYGNVMVVGIIAVAILYMLYEFRYDIRNQIELARRYFAARGSTREET